LKSEILLEVTAQFPVSKRDEKGLLWWHLSRLQKKAYINVWCCGMASGRNVWWQEGCTSKDMHNETNYDDG
jgi:hypothetical protein